MLKRKRVSGVFLSILAGGLTSFFKHGYTGLLRIYSLGITGTALDIFLSVKICVDLWLIFFLKLLLGRNPYAVIIFH